MPDSQPSLRSTPSIDHETATWYARRDAGLSASDQAEFNRWLAADPRHAAAWREFDDSLGRFDTARRSGLATGMIQELALRRQQRQRRHWRNLAGGAAIAVGAAACAILLFRSPGAAPQALPSPSGPVVVSKPARRDLPDGTVVDLRPGAAIEVSYSSARRDVRLVRGEAHFAVTKNLMRPFVVNAHGVEVRAVGTGFSVEAESTVIRVVVTEGRVAVERPAGMSTVPEAIPMDPVYADAGTRVSVPVAAAPEVSPIAPEEMERELAWRGPRLELSGTSLSDAVAAFNRESRVQLQIADPSLAGVRMSGVFRADHSEDFALMLERHYGVRLERNARGILLRAAP